MAAASNGSAGGAERVIASRRAPGAGVMEGTVASGADEEGG